MGCAAGCGIGAGVLWIAGCLVCILLLTMCSVHAFITPHSRSCIWPCWQLVARCLQTAAALTRSLLRLRPAVPSRTTLWCTATCESWPSAALQHWSIDGAAAAEQTASAWHWTGSDCTAHANVNMSGLLVSALFHTGLCHAPRQVYRGHARTAVGGGVAMPIVIL